MQRLRFKHGLRWRSKYPNPFLDYTRGTRIALLLVVLLMALAVHKRVAADELSHVNHVEQCAKAEVLKQSYLDVVLQCMNGNCRFRVGDELFSLQGGSLGGVK